MEELRPSTNFTLFISHINFSIQYLGQVKSVTTLTYITLGVHIPNESYQSSFSVILILVVVQSTLTVGPVLFQASRVVEP